MKVLPFSPEELKVLDPTNGVLLGKRDSVGNGAFQTQKTAPDPLLFIISPHRGESFFHSPMMYTCQLLNNEQTLMHTPTCSSLRERVQERKSEGTLFLHKVLFQPDAIFSPWPL